LITNVGVGSGAPAGAAAGGGAAAEDAKEEGTSCNDVLLIQ